MLSTKYLIGYYDTNVKEFYEISKLKTYIDEQNLEKIFVYAKNNKNNLEIKRRPEPLVANYGNKLGEFAFRRWVKNVIDDPSNNIELKKQIPVTKFHNTNLKGNEYVLTSQDIEDVIAISYNNINGIQQM
ncbi:MAG: hypothetical protein IKO36_12145 [Bacteroidaceae bacterium]|nr:hypothetical protein [Bacteroidaceae bacterium]